MLGALGGQRREYLELKLWVVVNLPVGAGNESAMNHVFLTAEPSLYA